MSTAVENTMSTVNGAGKVLKRKLNDCDMPATIESMAHSAGKSLGEVASQFVDSAEDYAEEGRRYIRKNPLTGVAAAAAVGMIAGGLLSTALRRPR